MTDNDIIKALKEILELMLCEGDLQRAATISHAIDRINRQKAEIERLEKQLVFEIESAYDRGRKTAIKEFAERLKDKITMSPHSFISIDKWYIDNFVKEKVGDDNA